MTPGHANKWTNCLTYQLYRYTNSLRVQNHKYSNTGINVTTTFARLSYSYLQRWVLSNADVVITSGMKLLRSFVKFSIWFKIHYTWICTPAPTHTSNLNALLPECRHFS